MGDCLLAVAAPSFHQPSETFVRAHARSLAPGRTVLICEDEWQAERLGCPVLSRLDPYPAPRTLGERVANSLRFRWRQHVDAALGGSAERRVRAFLEAHRPRALLAEFGPTACRLRRACLRSGVALYAHFHGFDATQLGREPGWRRHYRLLFRDAAGVIAPSRFLAERLRALGCPEAKLHVSPNGIDPNRFSPSSREPGLIVAVGRLVEKKAPHLTIRAFAAVNHRLPDTQAHFDRRRPAAGSVRSEIARNGLVGKVHLLGKQPRPRESVHCCRVHSCFVQHSVEARNGDMESFGVSLIEAMASKVPIVATRHNGIVDTVSDGETGVLVAEHDVQGMAEAMYALLSDPDRATRMGEAGRARVEAMFTQDGAAARLRAIMGLDTFTPRHAS